MTQFLPGHFLIAESELGDPNFVETVVLMISHDAEGAFGLVVNRKSALTLGEAAPGYRESALAGLPMYVGGPVEQEYLFTLHSGLPERQGGEFQKPVVPGVVFDPDFQSLEKTVVENPGRKPPEIRLFAGYSGWGAGQLEGELSEGAWVIMPATADLVFNPNPKEGWREALRRKGGVYWALAETGYKPSMN